jgi:CO/xanthine dehydrogenase FAD-binding subunit
MDLNTITEVARPHGRNDIPAIRSGDAFLGGGTWLFSEPQPKLTRLIDLAGLGWQPLVASEAGLEIAATCTIAQLQTFTAPPGWLAVPLIGQCARAFLASFKIWNAATVGGNLCMALPAGPMISLTAALDGICTIWAADGSERSVPVSDFVLGPQRNALAAGELLRRIDLPSEALARRAAFRQVSLAPIGRSGALLIGTLGRGGFTLTITASTPKPVKLVFDALPSKKDLHARIEAAIAPEAYYDDIHGLPAWRRHMTLHLAEEIRAELSMEQAK